MPILPFFSVFCLKKCCTIFELDQNLQLIPAVVWYQGVFENPNNDEKKLILSIKPLENWVEVSMFPNKF